MSETAKLRLDGLMDVVRGLAPVGYNQQGLSSFHLPAYAYETDGLAAVIVDRPAEDAVSRGWAIEGDDNATIANELDRLDATIHLTDAIRWARLYGASAILMLTEDGAALDQPLDPGNLRLITDLVVYTGDTIEPETERYSDPRFRSYGLPVRYRLAPEHGGTFTVHESRLIPFRGDPLPRQARYGARLPWAGRSCLEGCQRDLDRYRAGLTLARQVFERKQQGVHQMAGLTELLATAEGTALVRAKIALTDSVRGVINGITIDGGPGNGVANSGDDYKIIDLSLAGIDSVLGEFRDAISATTRIPQTVLFGSDVKGLGSTGSGEQSMYHALVKSMQERSLRPAIESLAGWIWSQKAVPEAEPEHWQLRFNGLWSPTDLEIADVKTKEALARKVHMEAVVAMLDGQLVTPEEARDMARLAFPELPEGSPPVQEELPDDPTEVDRAI